MENNYNINKKIRLNNGLLITSIGNEINQIIRNLEFENVIKIRYNTVNRLIDTAIVYEKEKLDDIKNDKVKKSIESG